MKHLKLGSRVGLGRPLAGHMYKGNPYPMYRPFGSGIMRNPAVMAVTRNIVHPIKMESLYDMVSATVGAVGTAALPAHWLVSKIPVIGNIKVLKLLLGNALNMTAMASAARMLPWVKTKPGVSKNIILGGLTMTGLQMFMLLTKQLPNVTVLQKVASSTAMAGLGAGNDVLRSKIEEAVKRELGQPEAESSFSTVNGLPYESSYSTVGSPKAESSYSTIGKGDDLTDDDMN